MLRVSQFTKSVNLRVNGRRNKSKMNFQRTYKSILPSPVSTKMNLDRTQQRSMRTFCTSEQAVIELDENNFNNFVQRVDKPIMLECYTANDKAPFSSLQGMVAKENGDILLGRINISNFMDLAKQLKIVSTPCVMTFVQGKIYPERMLPNFGSEMIAEYISNVMRYFYSAESSPKHQEAIQALMDKDLDKCSQIWTELLNNKKYRMEPHALAGLAAVAFESGRTQDAHEIIESVKAAYPKDMDNVFINSVVSKISLGDLVTSEASEEELLALVQSNPKDFESLYNLGVLYYSQSKNEEAINYLLKIVREDKEWNDKAAINMLMKIFDLLGPNDPVAIKGRRRLGNVIF